MASLSFGVAEEYLYVMAAGGGLKPSKGVSRLKLDQVLTIGEKDRDDKLLRGMFYCDPTVSAKCTYQNPELAHVRVDVAKVGSWTSHVSRE